MATSTMSVRDFHKNSPKIARLIKAGATIIVEKYNKPFFKVTPIEVKKMKKYSRVEVLQKLQFHSGDKELSMSIDKVLYS